MRAVKGCIILIINIDRMREHSVWTDMGGGVTGNHRIHDLIVRWTVFMEIILDKEEALA